MDFVNELDVASVVLAACDIICSVVVVCAEIDDDNISCWMSGEVPRLWVLSPDFNGPSGGIRSVQPLIGLYQVRDFDD